MCVVSMITDWGRQQPPPRWVDPHFRTDFRELYRDAQKYDRDNGEPDCELEDKQRALQEIARQMGVEIVFPKKLVDKMTFTTNVIPAGDTETVSDPAVWAVNSAGNVATGGDHGN